MIELTAEGRLFMQSISLEKDGQDIKQLKEETGMPHSECKKAYCNALGHFGAALAALSKE